MRRIAIINQKGGVGKTTTCANLGAALALQGRRVVVVDMDAQANLSLSLGTEIPSSVLTAAAAIGLVGAVALGVAGLTRLGIGLLPFIALGVMFVFAYNLELLGGKLHGDFWFALSWGAFPVLTAYFAQTGRVSIGAVGAAVAALALSFGQRSLSTPARLLRRRSRSVTGNVAMLDGSVIELDKATLLRPLERALQAFSWGVVALAVGMVASKVI